jgi:Asp-tRNA(Asn)/Glu-tRNA(Gln) amidotransferase A subunit family amidase
MLCITQQIPFVSLHSVTGPIARSVEDVAMFLDVMITKEEPDTNNETKGKENFKQGKQSRDSWNKYWLGYSSPKDSLLSSYTNFRVAALSEVKPNKILYSSNLGLPSSICPIYTNVNVVAKKAACWFESIGTTVDIMKEDDGSINGKPNTFFIFELLQHLGPSCFLNQRAKMFSDEFLHWKKNKDENHLWNILKPESKWNALSGENISHTLDDQTNQYNIIKEMSTLFQTYDILITPACIIPPFDCTLRYPNKINNVDLNSGYLGWMVLSWIITITNSPSLVVPCGIDDQTGLPIAIQIIGQIGDDGIVLSTGRLYEQAHKWCLNVPVNVPKAGTKPLNSENGRNDVNGPRTIEEAREHHFQKSTTMKNKDL